MDTAELRAKVDPSFSQIPVWRQCEVLGLPRSTYYYTPRGESPENLLYMRLLDEEYLLHPHKGVGQLSLFLRREGHRVNPKRVRRLLRLMGLHAVCPGPHTSKPGKGAGYQVFPYLLRGLKLEHVGQVVGTDITYVPMDGGFLYLTAFMDWYSRYILSWELSNSLDAGFCLQALDRIWEQADVQIVNTDQGAQYTGKAFVEAVTGRKGVSLSMDGKGRALDNVYTERFWRTIKREDIYLRSYGDGQQAWKGIRAYIDYYNRQRGHSGLAGATPWEVFTGKRDGIPLIIGNAR